LSLSTAYRYLHEAIDVLAGAAPSLRGALLAARIAGHTHVNIDGALIRTDRSKAAGPTLGVDLWWSGKHHHHGGNVQVVTGPDGWPLWTSPVRPGREHDTTCARTHGLLDALSEWTDTEHAVLAELGYEGENTRLTCPIKNTREVELTRSSAPSTPCTRPPEHWPNVETPCSRPPSKDYAGSPCAQGGSARSPPRHWSCYTTNTTAPHDHPGKPAPTDKGSFDASLCLGAARGERRAVVDR
jgi:DDE superfamily endonuclease